MNLKALFLRSEDSNENNPLCQLEGYRREFLDALPQLQFLDGAHVSLEHTCSVMEAKLAGITPDPRLCQTPPLEPWLGDATPSLDSEPIDFTSTFDDLQAALDSTKVMLNVDSTHLLKNASAALSRAKTSL